MKPTFEEFKESVKQGFAECMPNLTDAEVEKYLSTEDSQDVIKNAYEMSEYYLERGEITESVFTTGGVSAASSCLYLLY